MLLATASGSAICDPRSKAFGEVLGAFLQNSGILDRASVERAQRAAQTTGERFDQVLTRLGLLSEADLAEGLSRYLGLPLYAPDGRPTPFLVGDLLPLPFIIQNRILPVRVASDAVTIAVVDPFDRLVLDSVRFAIDRPVQYEIITPAEFEKAVASLQSGSGAPDLSSVPATSGAQPNEHDIERLRDSASEAPVVRMVNQIISDAVDSRASDIHIEPDVDGLKIRFRVDGVLRTVDQVPQSLMAAIISRIKIIAKLDIAERRLPQDGRIKLAVRGNEIDFRVATIPTMTGESVVMRILDRGRVQLEFEELGFYDDQIGTLARLMAHANGIILVTGPTGSGKTTTLYTCLKRLNRPSVKIFTVEDPIEYQLSGINQVQVQPSIGLDFPASLRAILRQDPDLIMIGEIRDSETARIAVQASLTGHLVFSTLHTNSAAETITRLVDMGVEHFLVGSTIRGIIAQRLVRRLCDSCSRPHEHADYWVRHLTHQCSSIEDHGPANLRSPVGCERCRQTGFLGRASIAEILVATEGVQQAVLQRRPAAEIGEVAREDGMMTMYEDGIAKVWRGLTTVEEVVRVTDNH